MRGRLAVHPLVLFLLPLLASPFVLVDGNWRFLLGAILVAWSAAWLGGARLAGRTAVVCLVAFLLVFVGFCGWIGAAKAAVVGLRMSSVATMLVCLYSLLSWQVLADSLVAHFRVPYPLTDVVAMGHRFAALMRREAREISTRLRIEARGSTWRWVVSLPLLVVPMLVSAFRLADQTAIAMEGRGFASAPQRTTHYARRLRIWDGVVVASTLAGLSIGAAVL